MESRPWTDEEKRLGFARAATARQRRKAEDRGWLIRMIAAAFEANDLDEARRLALNAKTIIDQRRDAYRKIGKGHR